MATFHSEGKMIAVRVLPEIYNSMNIELSNINATSSEQFQDKNLNKEVLLNALLVYYLSRDKSLRRAILRKCLRVVEGMLENRDKPKDDIDDARLIIPQMWDDEISKDDKKAGK